jgi:predicted kinase
MTASNAINRLLAAARLRADAARVGLSGGAAHRTRSATSALDKIDVHVHINSPDGALIDQAAPTAFVC